VDYSKTDHKSQDMKGNPEVNSSRGFRTDTNLFLLGNLLVSMTKESKEGPVEVKRILDSATQHALINKSRYCSPLSSEVPLSIAHHLKMSFDTGLD
jgi:hypothetical protein